MKVYVTVYEHRHGTDVLVFDSRAKAEAWRTEIAIQWWENEFSGEPKPGDDTIADVYFERMADAVGQGEFFNIYESNVE